MAEWLRQAPQALERLLGRMDAEAVLDRLLRHSASESSMGCGLGAWRGRGADSRETRGNVHDRFRRHYRWWGHVGSEAAVAVARTGVP